MFSTLIIRFARCRRIVSLSQLFIYEKIPASLSIIERLSGVPFGEFAAASLLGINWNFRSVPKAIGSGVVHERGFYHYRATPK